MKIKNLIKAIFFVSALINLTPSANATQFFFNDAEVVPQSKSINWINKVSTKRIPASIDTFQKYKDNYKNDSKDHILQTYRDYSSLLLANSLDIKNELEIQSDIQSEENNIIKAEALKSKKLVNSFKGDFFYSLDQKSQ